MIEIPFLDLETETEEEAYSLIDKHLRLLPRNSDGIFNTAFKEFHHNDVDALRHAYVSGVFAMEYNAITSDMLGRLRELFPGNSPAGNLRQQSRARNMDLWNNAVDRRYGKISKTREELFQHLFEALKKGELIIDLSDPRKHPEDTDSKDDNIKERVVVLKENETGENTLFLDTQTLLIFFKRRLCDQNQGQRIWR